LNNGIDYYNTFFWLLKGARGDHYGQGKTNIRPEEEKSGTNKYTSNYNHHLNVLFMI
jgi:hypothetical protein